MKVSTQDRVIEFLYLPVLTFFATRSCQFCFSIGFFELYSKVFALWLVFIPLMKSSGKIGSEYRIPLYVTLWAVQGLVIGWVNILQYAFLPVSLIGILLNSIMGGVLLALFQQSRHLRIIIEQRLLRKDKVTTDSLPESSTSLIRQMTRNVIIVNVFSMVVIGSSFFKYFSHAANVPQQFRQRSLEQFLIESVAVFLLHVVFSILLALELKKLFQTAFSASSSTMELIAAGEFDRKFPFIGNNEIGTLATAINSLADGLRDREHAKNIFGKYLSKKVAEKVLKAGVPELGGESKSVAIFLSDIKNFASITEKTEAKQLVRNLNGDLEVLVSNIEEQNGIIDKFIGDACLAYFDPASCTKPASSALQAARKIAADPSLNYEIGIGLHFGQVIAGNVGSQRRLEYTIIGDAVNTVARIESQTRNYQRKIIVTDDFKQILQNEGTSEPFDDLGLVSLKGKEHKVQLWAVPN